MRNQRSTSKIEIKDPWSHCIDSDTLRSQVQMRHTTNEDIQEIAQNQPKLDPQRAKQLNGLK